MKSQATQQLEETMKLGFQHHANGELEKAKNLYELVLDTDPRHFNALQLLGTLCSSLKLFDKAVDYFKRAVQINQSNYVVYNNMANALKELGRLDEALENCEISIGIKQDNAQAFCIRGAVLQSMGNYHDAISSCQTAIDLMPDFAEAYNNLGNALLDTKDFEKALISFNQALKINPHDGAVYFNRAAALQALWRIDEAIQNLDLAIEIQPDFADAYNNRGVALLGVKRYLDALKDFEHSLQLSPNQADAYVNRGNALRGMKKIEEALMSYQAALELNPEFDYLFGTWLHLKMKICDWSDFESNRDKLRAGILSGKKISIPFAVLSLIDDSSLHLKAARIYHQKNQQSKIYPLSILNNQGPRKIRIGYYSADFRDHATSYLIAGLIESHDKNKFEIYGFSFGPHVVDAMHARLLSSFDQLFEVSKMNDQEVIDLSRNIGIDIAIDLKGDTEDARVGLFTGRCAPVQVNYLGYPGSMGLDCYDYILADKVVLPEKNHSHYSEKVVSLPHSYQVNDSRRRISDRLFTKTELGLPEEGFIFCCFNNSYKILPQTFDLWMEILKNVEGSVLWLYSDTSQTIINLKREAEARGVSSQRLIFAEMMSHAEHLARHRCADLFLDTLPYNAHTTASDALWAGLPILTCMGESFASRVAASLIKAVDLEEMIALDQMDYLTKAKELGQDVQRMALLKKKLNNNLRRTNLFDTAKFTTAIESAYISMHENQFT